MSNKETLEEAALNFAITIQTKEGTVSRINAIEWFKSGAKEQAKKMYNEIHSILENILFWDNLPEEDNEIIKKWLSDYKQNNEQ